MLVDVDTLEKQPVINRIWENFLLKSEIDQGLSISVRIFKSLGVFALFSLVIEEFKFFPYFRPIQELSVLVLFGFLIHTCIQIAWGKRLSGFEVYNIFVIIFIPLLSSITARFVFGQPVIYGLLAERGMIFVVGSLLVISLLRSGRLSLVDLEKGLIFGGWLTLIAYSLLYLFVPPGQFSEYEGFVGGGGVEPYQYHFVGLFIIFSFCYYFIQWIQTGRARAGIFTVLFFSYLVLDGGRSLLISVFAAGGIYLVKAASPRLWIIRILPGMAFFIMGGLFYLNTPHGMFLLEKFHAAFQVVFTGQETTDASANARIFETLVALPYIQDHWLLGNGKISHRWHEGFEGVMGAYFYPSDIGLVGALFLYGVVGLAILGYQLVYLWRCRRIFRMKRRLVFADALVVFLLYQVIHSFVTGRIF
ncbi:MAG: hypothetical protein D6732_10560, partial [Methanobacteriota archaeon]